MICKYLRLLLYIVIVAVCAKCLIYWPGKRATDTDGRWTGQTAAAILGEKQQKVHGSGTI